MHEMPAPSLLDPQPLARLREFADGAVVCRLIDQCLDTATQRLGAARAALSRGDASSVAAEAHALKSSAGIIGARRLQQLADELHAAARRGDGAAMAALLREAEQIFPPTVDAALAARSRVAP